MWRALIAAFVVLGACGGDDGPACALTCGRRSTAGSADVPTVALACGATPVDCSFTYDQQARVTAMSCSYANGKVAACEGVTYDAAGAIVGGSCSGEGQTCALP